MVDKFFVEKANRKKSGSVTQKGTTGSNNPENIDVDDSLTIRALRDEVVRKSRGKFKGDKSTADASKSGEGLDIVRGEARVGKKTSKSNPRGLYSTVMKSKYGSGLKVLKEGEAAESSTVKKNEEEKTPMKRKRGADGEIVRAYLSSSETNSSRLRTRKEVPAFRMVDLGETDNDRIIGKRVKVYWSGSRKWFTGCIRSFNNEKRLHDILYEDGDKEELDLRSEQFELEIMPSEGFNLRTTSNSAKKVGSVDGGKVSADAMTVESVKVDDAEKMRENKKASKKRRKRRRSKSQPKDAKLIKAEDSAAKMDVDELPKIVNEVITDDVCDAEKPGEAGFEKELEESKSISETAREATETSEAHVPGLELQSEVKNMVSDNCGSEESRKIVKDDSIKLGSVKLLKRSVSLKKKATQRAAEMRTSKFKRRKDSNEQEKSDADMEVDVHQAACVEVSLHTEEVKEELISREIKLQAPGNVDTVKNDNETESKSEAESEPACEVPADMLRAIPETPEENLDILQGKVEMENNESVVDIAKEVVLVSKETAKARKATSNDNSES